MLAAGCQAGRAEQPVERAPADRAEIKLSFAPVVRAAAPAVVNIHSRARQVRSPLGEVFRDPFFRRFFGGAPDDRPRENSLGSGVIVRPDGLIVTNHHVVESADEIMVVLADRRVFEAEVLAMDEPSDLALLDIDVGQEALPSVPFGDPDAMQVGDLVLAIGNPFGIGQTVTSGIVSALGRSAPSLRAAASFIQTDAAINPGNSGGALVDLDGRLVGINTAIYTRTGGSIGIGFAIPVNLVEALIRSIEEGEDHLERGWFGARLRPVSPEIAEALEMDRPVGLLIEELYPGGPAERAGLRRGDVVMRFDGFDLFDERALEFRLAVAPLGSRTPLDVWRNGGERELAFEVEAPPLDPPPDPTTLSGRHPLAGATVANLSPAFNQEVQIDLFARGVIVVGLDPGAPAARIGLRRGDRLVRLNDVEVETVDQLEDAVRRARPPWQVEIERGQRRLEVRVAG
ncbi:MAG TPA: Do family serine endopeptidase [Geminicoccaceae bacterium]